MSRNCPACGQSWAVHNDDGSCVNDADLEDPEYAIAKANKEFAADLDHCDYLHDRNVERNMKER